jgi:hypothetical protein
MFVNAFLTLSNCQMCDQNSALDNLAKISGVGFKHPLWQTSNLVALYGLSLCCKETQIESHTTGALESPIKSKN